MTRGHTTSVWDAYVAIHCGTLAVCWYSLCNTDRMLAFTQRNVLTVVHCAYGAIC